LAFTSGFQHLADIGTDHAFLPIEAVLRGYVVDAIAIDNKIGPYEQAVSNVKLHQLQNRIHVSLGEGLEAIVNHTDVVVIAGMGGETISDILLNGDLKNVKRLILQPNRDVALSRKTIMELGWKIIDEVVLEEHPRYYDIIVAERGKVNYSDLELRHGPLLLKTKPFYFTKRLAEQKAQMEMILQRVKDKNKRAEIMNKLHELKEILDERE